jgi:hypothetical protein
MTCTIGSKNSKIITNLDVKRDIVYGSKGIYYLIPVFNLIMKEV